MFALLAMAGDLGGSVGPVIVGRVTQLAGDNIRTGMTVGLIFPVVLVAGLLIFDKMADYTFNMAVKAREYCINRCSD